MQFSKKYNIFTNKLMVGKVWEWSFWIVFLALSECSIFLTVLWIAHVANQIWITAYFFGTVLPSADYLLMTIGDLVFIVGNNSLTEWSGKAL